MSLLEDSIESALKHCKYDPDSCASLSQRLAGDVQEEIKDLALDRYRFITLVHIGEGDQAQSIRVASRALWDTDVDSFVTYNFQNKWIYCIATVYGIYMD